MGFDIDAVLGDMLSAMKDSVDADRYEVEGYAKQILENERDVLANLADQWLRGEITEDELKSELEDERDTIEAEMKACNVMTKVMVQRAANAAIDVLYKGIKVAL